MRIAPSVIISAEQQKTLEQWSRGRSTPARLVLRAQIVLQAAAGVANNVIAQELGTDRLLVGKWRKRFVDHGLAGIEKDAPRGGRPPVSRDAMTARIIEWTTQKKPKSATHWSCRTLAKELGTRAFTCTLSRPAAHGSISWKDGSARSPTRESVAALSKACPN